MAITFREIEQVDFPVYELPNGNWYEQDGLVFLDKEIVDDKNQTGETLGIRRIQTPLKNLLPLKKQVDTIRGIVKGNHKYFVDSKGMCFAYSKSLFCILRYFKIKKVNLKESHATITLVNHKDDFKVPRPPPPDMMYAGCIVYNGRPWVLYNYSETKLKDTRRKV